MSDLYNTSAYNSTLHYNVSGYSAGYNNGLYNDLTYLGTSFVDYQSFIPVESSIFIRRGFSFYNDVVLKDLNKNPINLFNYSLSGIIFHNVESETIYPLTIRVDGDTTGELSFSLPSGLTKDLDKPIYRYEIYGVAGDTKVLFKYGSAYILQGR